MGYAVLSDLITTFYLTKTFYDMKSTSDRSVGFFMRSFLLLIVLLLSTLCSQDAIVEAENINPILSFQQNGIIL